MNQPSDIAHLTELSKQAMYQQQILRLRNKYIKTLEAREAAKRTDSPIYLI